MVDHICMSNLNESEYKFDLDLEPTTFIKLDNQSIQFAMNIEVLNGFEPEILVDAMSMVEETSQSIKIVELFTEISSNLSTEPGVEKLQSSSIMMFPMYVRLPNIYNLLSAFYHSKHIYRISNL